MAGADADYALSTCTKNESLIIPIAALAIFKGGWRVTRAGFSGGDQGSSSNVRMRLAELF